MSTIFCHCKNAGLIPENILRSVLERLKKSSQDVFCVDDLCALAAKQDPLFTQWAKQDDLIVLACFPRVVKALFAHANTNLSPSGKMINLRTMQNPESVIEVINSICDISENDNLKEPISISASDPDWQPWFPLIDYDRCKNCKQCLNFCLFGVYSMNDQGHVQVSGPHQCKTNCPACARVCPYAAIIFPKYEKSPINGDEVVESEWKKSHAQAAESLKDRLSGDIYQLLHNRKDGSVSPQSLDDLKSLKDQLDIPDDVF